MHAINLSVVEVIELQGLYDGMNFFAGVVSLIGFVAIVLALIGLGQKPRGLHFIFSILTLGFFALLTLPAAITDISTLIFVQKERMARPKSEMETLPSIYFPQAEYELLFEFCWGNPSYGCNVDLYKFAAQGGDVFLETGTDPIYRWRYVENDAACFDENRLVVFIPDQAQLLARGVCFLLSKVDTSEAEYRFTIGSAEGYRPFERRAILFNQKTDTIVDNQLRYRPTRWGYPFPLGNKMRHGFGYFGVEFEDYTDGAIFDMLKLIENSEIPGYPVRQRYSRQPNPLSPGVAPWQSDVAILGLASDEWAVSLLAFKASCQMWNETSPALREKLLAFVRSNDSINTDCGHLGCFELDAQGEWHSVQCEY